MPSREPPSYSSSRVQRASRLNALEQIRLQQKLALLENARQHQIKLTNQDIRLTSTALEYILNSSGHSLEGRGPTGQPGGVAEGDANQQEEPCFLYGERVVSRKVRRMPRPHSAVERSTYRRASATSPRDRDKQNGASEDEGDGGDSVTAARNRLPPRPQSSPAKGRSSTWATAWSCNGNADENRGGAWGSPNGDSSAVDSERAPSRSGCSTPGAASRPSTGRATPAGKGGRTTPHQAWEDDTDEVTKRILKAQKQKQQQQEQQQEFLSRRRSNRYMQDISRMQQSRQASKAFRQSRGGGIGGGGGGGSGGGGHPPSSPFPGSSTAPSPALYPPSASPSPRIASPWERPRTSTPNPYHQQQQQHHPVIEDRKPVSPSEKRSRSAQLGKRAGVTEIMSQARATISAGAWRAHLASTPMVPRSAESQHQVIMEARKNSERQRQEHVKHKVETFIGELDKNRN